MTVALFMLLVSSTALSMPVLSEARTAAGLSVYPDHAVRTLWWYVPTRLELASEEGHPAFHFQRFRYTGSRKMGDAGTFKGRGVLAFTVRFASSAKQVQKARDVLRGYTRSAVELRPIPLEKVESALVYVTAGGEPASGVLENGTWSAASAVWQERGYTLGLDTNTTQLLWEAAHLDGVAMSLNYGLVGQAVARRPAPGRKPEATAATFAAGALPIRVSPQECANCFTDTEIDAELPAGYTFLDVLCFDFQSASAPPDLALVIVDVQAHSPLGTHPNAQLRFRRGEGVTRRSIAFDLVVDLDRGYAYRVSRIYTDGKTEEGTWNPVDSWTGIRDVTRYRDSAGASGLDPRMLY